MKRVLLLAGSLAFGRVAPAQAQVPLLPGPEPASADAAVDHSREEFRRASTLARAERWREALDAYRRAHRLYAHATTLLNAGYCEEKLGNAAAAYRDTLAALAFSRENPDRGIGKERVAEVEATLGALEARTARVTFPPTTVDFEVTVDGRPLVPITVGGRTFLFATDEAPLARPRFERATTLVLDPGWRRLRARNSAGETPLEIELTAGVEVTVAWPPAANGPPATKLAPTLAPAPAAPGPRVSTPAESQRLELGSVPPSRPNLRPWAIGSFVLGGASLVAGVASGLIAMSAKDDLDAACQENGGCPEDMADTIDRFELNSTIANVAFVTAAAAAGAGATLLIIDGASRSSARVELRWSVAGRVDVRGRF
jgi:tetratricopeptide (TPR) repeat protein